MPRAKPIIGVFLAVAAAAPGLLPGAATAASAATPVPFGPDLAANGWQLLTFPRRSPARFAAQNPRTLAVDADRAVAVLWRPISPAMNGTTAAKWRWRVDHSVGPTDLARKGGDDRALSVYFVFSDAAAQSGPIDLMRAMRSGQAKILMYVWGGSAPKGSVLPSPYFGAHGRTIVLESGHDPIGQWNSARVDLRADYRKAFGAAAPALVALAVSSDSDDTAGRNVAAISDLVVNP